MFEPSFVCCAFEAKFLPSKLHCHAHINMFAHVHLRNLNVWLIMWVCSRKVEAVLLAASVTFLCLNPSRNSDRNKTSTRFKAIIQFWRHSVDNQGKSNIDKKMCKSSDIHLFLLTKLRMLFCNPRPSPTLQYVHVHVFKVHKNTAELF